MKSDILHAKANQKMDKAEVYKYLTDNHINYEITEHKTVCNMAELEAVELPYPDGMGKIFLS